MNKTRNTTKAQYTFNHPAKKILISKRFSNAAEKINSTEYKELVKLITDFPTYTIEVVEFKKNTNKLSYKGLTIDQMRRFIQTQSDEEAELFEKVINIAANKTSPYAVIKKWFLKRYKEAYLNEVENTTLNAENASIEAELDELANESDEICDETLDTKNVA